MRLGLLAIIVALALGAVAWAQPAPTLYWEHDGLNVTSFTCQIDSGSQVSLGLPTPSGTTYSSALSNCGTLTNGQHTLTIRACNAVGCTAAAAIYVVKLEPEVPPSWEWVWK